jgi:UDP-glucuronate decarboxylase
MPDGLRVIAAVKTGMRILVTGGAGFLGSHLCTRLLSLGHHVISVDDFSTGSRKALDHLTGNPRLEVVCHDVVQPLHIEVDQIYNLACPASPIQYQRDPVKTTRTSVIGAINLLELANRLKIKILQASTSEVYGDPEVHPQTEDYWGHVNPIGPRSCYDEGKRCAETLFFDYRRQHNVAIKVARIFNTYGPGLHMNDGRVVSNFIVQALTNQDIIINGNGDQTRSFCYVKDLIDGLIRLMATGPDVTGPINLGNPSECGIAELAKLIVTLTGSHSKLQFMKAVGDDPRRRKPDISAARRLLDWQPTTPLAEGLGRTIAYFDGVLASQELA